MIMPEVRIRIFLSTPIVEEGFRQRLGDMKDLDLVVGGPADIARYAADVDVLVISALNYSSQVADALASPRSRCRWVQLLTNGYDSVLAAPIPANVLFTRMLGVIGHPTAEQAMTLLLALVRRIPSAIDAMKRQVWDVGIWPTVGSLVGQRLVIVGTGDVGSEIAHRARGFGMKIVGVSRHGRTNAAFDRVVSAGQLIDVLAEADVVVLALPLLATTRHIIGRAQIAAMPKGGLVINVSRGGTIDHEALYDGLVSGQLGGAGLDVTDPEPLAPGSPLWNAPNILITPHLGGAAPPSSYSGLVDFVVENIERYLQRNPLKGLIDLDDAHAAATAKPDIAAVIANAKA